MPKVEDVGGAAVDFCAVVEAGDEVFDCAAADSSILTTCNRVAGFVFVEPWRATRKEFASAGSLVESKYSRPSGELCAGNGVCAAGTLRQSSFLSRELNFGSEKTLAPGLKTVRPAVIRASFNRIKRVRGTIVAEMI